MRGKKIKVLKVDDNNRIYIYPKKVLYRQKKNGKWITKVSSPTLSGVLESDLIDENVKKKLTKILEKLNHFFNRGV